MFVGTNMFWAQLRLNLAQVEERVKMSSEKGQKHIYTQEHKLYYYYYHFGGHCENKNWKK